MRWAVGGVALLVWACGCQGAGEVAAVAVQGAAYGADAGAWRTSTEGTRARKRRTAQLSGRRAARLSP